MVYDGNEKKQNIEWSCHVTNKSQYLEIVEENLGGVGRWSKVTDSCLKGNMFS